jgi:hypothetical protein
MLVEGLRDNGIQNADVSSMMRARHRPPEQTSMLVKVPGAIRHVVVLTSIMVLSHQSPYLASASAISAYMTSI